MMESLGRFDRVVVKVSGREFTGRIIGETNDHRGWHILKDTSTEWPEPVLKRFCKLEKKMAKDPYDGDDFQRYADDMRKRLIPKMRESEHVLMIAPNLDDKFDIQFALQIGAAILLEKPLILVVAVDRVIPPKLRAIADKIIDVDFAALDETDIQAQIRRAMDDLGRQ
jgi:hypothetical protein